MPHLVNDNWHRAAELHKYGLAWVRERAKWLSDASILLTNVLALQPPGNKLEALCDKKEAVGGARYLYPSITKGKYLLPEFLPELDRLRREIELVKPNLVLCLGNTALWAVLGVTNISSVRGSVAEGVQQGVCPGRKSLATFHPAGVLRQWSWRPIVVADLMKAARELAYPEIRRPARQALVSPSLDELGHWTNQALDNPPAYLGVDCETAFGQIKCISFARSKSDAICVPFVDETKPGWSYWPSQGEEYAAWCCCQSLLACSAPKVFQNGLYDLQYILPMGLQVDMRQGEDTMLLHHSLFPELQKGLGFLGSIYSSEQSWKLMRRRKADTEKRDE